MKQIFLGHDRPLLHLTADYLIDRFYKNGRLDMRNVMLALQEQRAINRLEEILAEKAEEIDCAWYPPEFLTIGTLAERFYELKKPLADDLTQCFAWIHAVDQLDDENPDLLRRLVPSPPSRDDMESRLALGRMFAKLHRELAAGTLDFTHVADLCRKLKIESEISRWEALDKLQKKYLAKLDSLEIWDIQSARLYALERPEEFETKQTQFHKDGTKILLVGVVDMNLAQKELLRHFGKFVTSLVFAPENWSDRFDDLGCLIPHVWQNVHVELDDRQIHIVESTGDQAEEVLRCLTNLKGKYAPPEIIIGVPDKQVVPFIERLFEQTNIETRIVAGTSIRQTSVHRFLETLLSFLESPTFAHFATLVRHPDVEAFLRSKLSNVFNVVSELDKCYSKYLPVGMEAVERSDSLKAVWQQLQTLFATQDIAAILQEIFPEYKRDEAYHQILNTFTQIQEVPKELLSNPLTFVDTVRLALTQVGSALIPMPHEPNAIELVGWLDLATDDAEVVIVTGMNDGSVPAFQTSDMFLPDTMRQQLAKKYKLSIEDNSRRYARDAYALSCLLATRQYDPLRIQLIGSRRSVEGDPMLPSRLFFAADDETVAKRVKDFFAEHRKTLTKVHVAHDAKKPPVAFDLPKIPEGAGEKITAMRVTEFKDYKKCPYRYYLQYHFNLRAWNDAETELNAGAFGDLIHKVLESFGKTKELKNSTSAEDIRDYLVGAVRDFVRQEYGEQPRSVIAIQAERAIKRLEAFAVWQANWASEYEILDIELQFKDDRFSLDVDGKTMGLSGRIDRIDRHKKTNELMILDYKTGKKDNPNDHRKKEEWIDFQLPLYYHLLGQHAVYSDFLRKGFRLGYIRLPSVVAETGEKLTDWDRPTVLSAIEEARNVVRDIWDNRFDIVSPPPKYSEAFAAICNDF
jgi:RecB family exonuclease